MSLPHPRTIAQPGPPRVERATVVPVGAVLIDVREGRPVPGDNPVLMTFEGLLEAA